MAEDFPPYLHAADHAFQAFVDRIPKSAASPLAIILNRLKGTF